MTEYEIRAVETSGTGDVEKIRNDAVEDGWRLVSTNVESMGALKTRVWLFFERETGQPETQDAWRAQHGGEDAG